MGGRVFDGFFVERKFCARVGYGEPSWYMEKTHVMLAKREREDLANA